MLSKERLEEIVKDGTYYTNVSEGDLKWMARELLSLHDLPEMAEVDVLMKEFNESHFMADGVKRARIAEDLFLAARRSIATAHVQRQREITTLTAERDEARRQAEWWKNLYECDRVDIKGGTDH